MALAQRNIGMKSIGVGVLAMNIYGTRSGRAGSDGNSLYAPLFRYGEASKHLSHHPNFGGTDTINIARSIMSGEFYQYNGAVVIEIDA